MADPEFTFIKFTGDCAPLGLMQMTGPRTCGATFSPTAQVSSIPVLRDDIARGRKGGTVTTTVPPNARGGVVPQPQPPEPGQSAQSGATGASTGQTGATGQPPTTVTQPSKVNIVPPPTVAPVPVVPPPTDEEFAKVQIQDVLKAFCAGYEALDPKAVKVVQPKADLDALQRQMKQYKSAECKFAEPKFPALDPKAGNAKVEAELKRGYVFVGSAKPENYEQIATMTLVRPGPRTPWVIDTVAYKPKPK
jgi:hypothetical protein